MLHFTCASTFNIVHYGMLCHCLEELAIHTLSYINVNITACPGKIVVLQNLFKPPNILDGGKIFARQTQLTA